VEFDGMELSHPGTQKLKTVLDQKGYRLHSLPLENCWKLDLANSWDEQNQQFSKKHRRKTKKAICRLEDANSRTTFASEGNFSEFWKNFVDLHQKRRQAMSQEGCFSNPRFERFLRAAVQGLLQRELTEIIQISVGQKPIASTLLFHNGNNVFMYQTGFDPDYQLLEPGYSLIVSSLQWSIARGMTSFDFLRGDEEYKSRWNTKPIPMTKLRFVDTSSLGSRFRDLLWQGKVNARTGASRMMSRFIRSPEKSPSR